MSPGTPNNHSPILVIPASPSRNRVRYRKGVSFWVPRKAQPAGIYLGGDPGSRGGGLGRVGQGPGQANAEARPCAAGGARGRVPPGFPGTCPERGQGCPPGGGGSWTLPAPLLPPVTERVGGGRKQPRRNRKGGHVANKRLSAGAGGGVPPLRAGRGPSHHPPRGARPAMEGQCRVLPPYLS